MIMHTAKKLFFLFLFLSSNTAKTMEQPPQKTPSHQDLLTSILKEPLCPDMVKYILKLIQEEKIIPVELRATPQQLHLSNNWNQTITARPAPNYKNYQLRYGWAICPQKRDNALFCTLKDDKKNLCTFKIKGSKKSEFDGPNQDDVIVIAQESDHPWPFSTQYYLSYITPQSAQRKLPKNIHLNSPLLNQRIKTIALAAHYKFAIVAKKTFQNAETLSLYCYDKNLNSKLVAQSELPSTILRISFVTKNVLLGVTGLGRLISLWFDAENKLRWKLHRCPYYIQSFALDSQTPGQIMIRYIYEGKAHYATTNLKTIDSRNVVKFKKALPDSYAQTGGPLEYHGGVCYAPIPDSWALAAHNIHAFSPLGDNLPKTCIKYLLMQNLNK